MNLVFTTTGYQEFNAYTISVNKENINDLVVPNQPSSLDSIVVDMCFHLITQDKIEKFLTDVYIALKPMGTLKIHCLDVYEISQKLHRREINETSFNNIFYGNGQQNSLSSIFYGHKCAELGFKKKSIEFEGIITKLEFIK